MLFSCTRVFMGLQWSLVMSPSRLDGRIFLIVHPRREARGGIHKALSSENL
jgi:hypothetical protein